MNTPQKDDKARASEDKVEESKEDEKKGSGNKGEGCQDLDDH